MSYQYFAKTQKTICNKTSLSVTAWQTSGSALISTARQLKMIDK